MLDSNTNKANNAMAKTGGRATGGRTSGFGQTQNAKPKSTGVANRASAAGLGAGTVDIEVAGGGPGFGRRAGKNVQQSAFDIELTRLGASSADRKIINDYISKLVELCEVKTDSSVDKI